MTTIPGLPYMFLVSIFQTAHLWANTGVVFRELSFSRLECGVNDRLHIYPLCGIFYFPWHRHQIEGTNGFYCLIRKTERFTISNVESQVFTPRIILALPGRRTRAAGVQSVRPTTGLTAPLYGTNTGEMLLIKTFSSYN